MSKHTPGPWRMHGGRAIGTAEEDWQVVAYLDAHRNRRNWTDEEFHANGRLMAAAPELAQAAREALHFITNIDNAHPTVRLLREVLSKAGTA